MSLLILEDSPTRTKAFRQGFIGICTTTVNTSSLAISWLSDHTPLLICLDYDLDQYGMERSKAGTGYDVARFIASQYKRFTHAHIIVHSLNDLWAAKMVDVLRNKELSVSRHPKLWEEPKNMHKLMLTMQDLEIKTLIPA